jgi:hypothetical protein
MWQALRYWPEAADDPSISGIIMDVETEPDGADDEWDWVPEPQLPSRPLDEEEEG